MVILESIAQQYVQTYQFFSYKVNFNQVEH